MCVFCGNDLKRGAKNCSLCRRVQPSAQLAPFYREAISEDFTLSLGSSRQKLAARANELRALDKESKKPGYVKPIEVSSQKMTAQMERNTTRKIHRTVNLKSINLNEKSLLWIISIVIAILAIYLLAPSQKVSSPKDDRVLIENLFNGLNKATSAQAQFAYILANNYPGFLDAPTAKSCASGLTPATQNSYTPLASPNSVEFNTIKSVSTKFSKNYSFDGSYGPDNKVFKGSKIEGRTYSVKVRDKLSSGGQVYTFDKDVKVTVKDGKAFWYSHYC